MIGSKKFGAIAMMSALAHEFGAPKEIVTGIKKPYAPAKLPLTKKQKKVRAKNKQQRLSRKINRQKRA